MNLLNHDNVWQANNLPNGFTLENGVISGNPSVGGVYDVPVTVSNSLGTSTKNIRIVAKKRNSVFIMQNGALLENVTFAELQASIQDGTAQSKYNCTNTQMLIDVKHPITGATILDVPLNFCSFRTITLENGTTKTGLILQFSKTLWKGLAPFSTNGFNRWKYSQLRKWLNASGENWFTSSYTADTLTTHEGSYTDASAIGFLSCLPSAFVNALVPVKVITQAFFDDYNEDTAIEDPDYVNGLDADITYDKIFIPSLSEMGISADDFEGTAWEYYSALSSSTGIAQDLDGNACSIITRSAVVDGTTQVIYIDSSLQPFVSTPYNADSAPSPAFVIA